MKDTAYVALLGFRLKSRPDAETRVSSQEFGYEYGPENPVKFSNFCEELSTWGEGLVWANLCRVDTGEQVLRWVKA